MNRWQRAAAVGIVGFSVWASVAQAGYVCTTVIKTEGGKRGESQPMTTKTWVEGPKARIEFAEGSNPTMEKGTYILTQDGGQTAYLVNPPEKTYMKWDLGKMAGMAGSIMQMAKGFMQMKFSQPKVEKIAEEAGPSILGYSTRHFKYRTTYTIETRILGRTSSSAVDVDEDVWTTAKLKDLGLFAWAKTQDFKTGDDQLDALMKAEKQKMTGFPLKRISVHTTKDAKGNSQVSTTSMEVTELTEAKVKADLLEIPQGFTEQKLEIPQEGAKEEGQEQPKTEEAPKLPIKIPFGKLFGR